MEYSYLNRIIEVYYRLEYFSDGLFLNESFIWMNSRRTSRLGSDLFSRACAPSYRFCTGISSSVSSLRVWVIRSSCDCPIHVTYSVWGKKDLIIIIIMNNSLVYYLCYHIQCYRKEPAWQKSHIYKLQEIKSYNLRPETHHATVRVNNDNNNNNPHL